MTGNATSIYTSPLRFVKGAAKGEETSGEKDEKPAVDPSKIDDDDFNTKRAGASTAAEDPESIKVYTEPIKYEVPKTGYYCVGESNSEIEKLTSRCCSRHSPYRQARGT